MRGFEREIRNFVVGGLLFLLFLTLLSLMAYRNVTSWAREESFQKYRSEAEATALALRVSALSRRGSEESRGPEAMVSALASDARVATLLREAGARFAGLFDASLARRGRAGFLPDHDLTPARLEEGDRPGPSRTRIREVPGDALLVVVVTLPGPEESPPKEEAAFFAVGYDASALAMARRNEGILSVVIPFAALALLVLVVPFLRRLMRPIDALTETARDAGAVVPIVPAFQERAKDEAEHAIATFARTVGELKKRTQELDELRRREKERADALAVTAETLVRSHPGGVLVVDSKGNLVDANAPALAALASGRTLLGRPAKEALADYPPLVEAVEAAAAGRPTLAREFVAAEETRGRVFAVTAAPVVGTSAPEVAGTMEASESTSRLLGTLLFLEDRTREKRLQRELSTRRELAALGEMSAGIAHEFRNATATILGYTRLAATVTDEDARERHLRAIRAEAEHVARVTGDFLIFARPERVAPAHTPLAELVAEAVEEESVASPETEFEISGPFGHALVDPSLFRRALVNLLRNAREAAAEAGRLRVRVSGQGDEDGILRLAIEDDGVGVPREALAKVFVPFFSTKENGTGLGLALVAKIVAMHGGTVQVERATSLSGARFVISLPALPKPGALPFAP